jgi:photosystem II stability/assembly factor-like uncharacterized protein
MIILSFITFSLVAVSDLATAQWTKTSGPEGVQALSLASNGTLVAVGTYSGAYLSTNAGSSWNSIAVGIEGYWITSLLFRGNDLFAGTNGHGLLVRRSGSSTWQDQSGNLPFAYFASTSVLASDGTSLFAGAGYDFYRSTDDGTTWTRSDSGMTGKSISGVSSGNGILLATAGWDGLYKSTDGGKFWFTSNNGLGSVYVFRAGIAGSLFIVTTNNGFFLSTDNGMNWNPANATFSFPNFYGITSHASTILVTTYGAVYRSSDNGTNWSNTTAGIVNDGGGLCVWGDGSFFMVGARGMYRSTDDGLAWSIQNAGTKEPYIGNLVSDGTLVAAGTQAGLYVTSDEGTTWMDRSPDQSHAPVVGLAVDDQGTYYACFNPDLHVFSGYRSSDQGITWSSIADAVPIGEALFDYVWGNGNLYAPTTKGLFVSTNRGFSWSPATAPLGTITVRGFSVSGTAMVASTNRGVYLSTNAGTTWAQRNSGLPDTSYSSSILVHGSTVLLGNYSYGTFRSTDLGMNWGKMSSDLYSINEFVLIQQSYFAAGYYGIFQSTNEGSTWSRVGAGLIDSSGIAMTSLGHSDGSLTLFLATQWDGVWKRAGGELITGVDQSIVTGLPQEFRLDQNYPNPFNPQTEIEYRVPGLGLVTLKVYDLLGREVATLVNEQRQPGSYSVRFDGSRLASGIYMYRLTAGTFLDTKKMLLVK